MFEKANYNLVDMMKLKKVQVRQKYDEKKMQLALGMQVSSMPSGMVTPMRSSLGCGMQ